ncbi:uncharacterized protein LOC122665412 [Telopea speciosissima]|uniref:uncharacterized protein LOC122665412 n=1 Tax=Telopea speciosissima TaxID=54955 RepID=UPI001CC5A166|nr:uncharacterized protein LOC122665412 [Telopea speciosissima]
MEKFKKLHPPSFSKVKSDSLQPKRWISALKKAFEVLECTNAQKLICVGYQLQNEAAAWWKSARPNLEATHPDPTCDQFNKVFLKNYFLESLKDRKEAEFSVFTQGSKTVLEYQQRFEDLLHFAPDHLRNEASKTKKFEKGLKPKIRAMLSIMEIETYARMVDKAKTVEDRLKDKSTALQGLARRPSNFQNFNWPNKTFKSPGSPSPLQYRRPEVGQNLQPYHSAYNQSNQYVRPASSRATTSVQTPHSATSQASQASSQSARSVPPSQSTDPSRCFECGKSGHWAKDYIRRRNNIPSRFQSSGRPYLYQDGRTQGKVYVLTNEEAEADLEVMTGIFSKEPSNQA